MHQDGTSGFLVKVIVKLLKEKSVPLEGYPAKLGFTHSMHSRADLTLGCGESTAFISG